VSETAAEVLAEAAAAEPVRSRIAAHAGVTFAGLMIANVLGYVFYTLVSRTLGVEAYGTFSSLVAVVLILQAPALIAQMVVAKLATDFSLDADRLAGLVRAVDRVTLMVAGLAGLALIAAALPLAGFMRVADPLLVVLAGVALCGAVMLPFLRGVLQGTSAFKAFALSNVVEAAGKAVFAPVLGVVAGVRGAVAGLAAGYAVAAAYTFFAALQHRRGEQVPFSLRTVARSSATVAVAVVCLNVLVLYDIVLAKRYLDAHTAGLYTAAALASRALFAVIAFVPTVLLPQAAGRAARGQRTRALFGWAFCLAAAIAAASVGFFALAPHFVITTIAGPKFDAGAALLVPYVYAIAVLSLANVTATYNIARGRMQFVVPLACVAVGEIVAVVLRHRSAYDLLQVIAIGHTLALLACGVSLGAPRRGAGGDAPRSAAR
jgi:O-antigen/teichoic acid export membrane protein